MQKPQSNPGTPWALHLDRDGTEDFLIVRDADGYDLSRSEFFWQPVEEDEAVPTPLAAGWLMFNAPKLLKALKELAEQADHDCPAQSRSCHFIAAMEQANAIIAAATAKPPYIRRGGPGLHADATECPL
jgi:aminoglycoside phosphotransferase